MAWIGVIGVLTENGAQWDGGQYLSLTWMISKHAMFLKTVIVGHTHMQYVCVERVCLGGVRHIIKDVIPLDTSTATMATTRMVFGMLRHHYRMVPVATLARNLRRHSRIELYILRQNSISYPFIKDYFTIYNLTIAYPSVPSILAFNYHRLPTDSFVCLIVYYRILPIDDDTTTFVAKARPTIPKRAMAKFSIASSSKIPRLARKGANCPPRRTPGMV